jgi:hypothetical protein
VPKPDFEKKENPQTAILSHLWDCVMVTRTGIEQAERLLPFSSIMRKPPKNSLI